VSIGFGAPAGLGFATGRLHGRSAETEAAEAEAVETEAAEAERTDTEDAGV
jgi:hypothetical protein